jgi:SAM-dependent methyltransferase
VTNFPARWNHNIHYHPLILAEVPAGAQDALDVGCGEGMLARALRARVPRVVGVDLDPASLDLARSYGDDISYVQADVLTHPFAPSSFSFIASVAALHHMDARVALTRLRDLLRPGGTLVIVGLARATVADVPFELAGAVATRLHRRTKSYWEHPSPMVWPPPETYARMRRLASSVLPGVRYRRHVLWRYSLLWTKPCERPTRTDKS